MAESDAEEDSDSESGIQEATVQDVVRAIRDCDGHYAFFIGAGTSKPAGIPTGGDLIWEWKQERFSEEHDEDASEVDDEGISDWADSYKEENVEEDKNEYGFWFEEIHTTPGQRRHFIRDKVEDKQPTFGNIVLASMMADEYVPLTLTTNFDDLIYDSLYRFLEEKPLVINHDAVAAEFSLTKNRPTLIKLHGDYLYDNLQNLSDETKNLRRNMERAFSLALNEYGLVVLGYGGEDESIMDGVLLDDDLEIPEYGIYWCEMEGEELSEETKQLLENENTYLVRIDDSEAFLTKLANRIPGLDPPTEEELLENAEEKIDAMERTIEQREEEAESEEEEEYLDALQLQANAREHYENEEWGQAIEEASKAIESRQTAESYLIRGSAYYYLSEYEKAAEDYSQAFNIFQKRDNRKGEAMSLGNLGLIVKERGKLDAAKEYHEQSLAISQEIDDRQAAANSLDNLGEIAQKRGELDASEEYHLQSLTISRELGNPQGEASSFHSLGVVAQKRGELDASKDYYLKSLELARKTGGRHSEATIFKNLGEVAQKRGKLDDAEVYYYESLETMGELGDRHNEAKNLDNLGLVAQERDELDAAETHHQKAFEIAHEIGARLTALDTLENLVDVCEERDDIAEAIEWCDQAIEIAEELENEDEIEKFQTRRGELDSLQETSA